MSQQPISGPSHDCGHSVRHVGCPVCSPSEARFHVGQVVAMKHATRTATFKILGVMWEDDAGWYYQWNKRNWAAESLLRSLTLEECGLATPTHTGEPK